MQDEEQQNFIEIVGEAVDELNADIQLKEYFKKLLQTERKSSPVLSFQIKSKKLASNIKIIMHKSEDRHNKPHFHAIRNDGEVPFAIKTAERIKEKQTRNNKANEKLYRKAGKDIELWCKEFQQELICIWNNSRAGDRGKFLTNCQSCNSGKDKLLCYHKDGKYKNLINEREVEIKKHSLL